MTTPLTVFDGILAGDVPCQCVYEDSDVFAFHDVNPQAPVHIVIIPKTRITSLNEATDDHALVLGRLLCATKRIAQLMGVGEGYRVVFNTGAPGGQTVFYLHAHLLGGETFTGHLGDLSSRHCFVVKFTA